MKLLKTTGEFYREIIKLSKSKPKFFYVSTFNLSVDKEVKMIFSNLPKNCDTRLIIGLPNNFSLNQGLFFKKYFSDIKLKLLKNHHLKVVITDKAVIVGGRNLTNSGWNDLSIYLISKNTINQIKKDFLQNFSKKGL